MKPTRFRIPDICVILGNTAERVLTKPPFICIEVLSPDDRKNRVQERINDYHEMGVAYVWVLDPQTKRAYTATPQDGLRELTTGILRTENPSIEVALSEVFSR